MSKEENNNKLKALLMEVMMLDQEEYLDEKSHRDIEGWDSLATVAMAVGIHELFQCHMTPQEAVGIQTIGDIRRYLQSNQVDI